MLPSPTGTERVPARVEEGKTASIGRRKLIALMTGAAAAFPLAARAQSTKKKRVAVVQGGLLPGDADGHAEVAALEAGLKDLGWKLGDNIALDYRWPGAELESVQAAAKAVAASRPDLVVSRSTPTTAALMHTGLPIVFVLVADPIGAGFVHTFAQPGGNLTGFSNFEASVGGKWLELLKEAAPDVTRAALLFNPQTAPFAGGYLRAAQAAAQKLGLSVSSAPCGSPADIDSVVAAQARERGAGFIGITDTFLVEHRDHIVQLATRYRLPAVFGTRAFAQSGALMAYAADYPDIYRRAAGYVDRILRGTRPADLPVQEPAKFTLSVNLKAAAAIGLTLPQTLIAQADEVIE
jgi:putative ABC transport system substrate-binding protein